MPQKIILTEEQLNNVVNHLEEQAFDDIITKHQKETMKEISMSRNDAKVLTTFALKWCEGKDKLPDCRHIHQIWTKHELYQE